MPRPTRSNTRPVSPTPSSPLLASSSNGGQRSGGQRGVNRFVPYSMGESHSAQPGPSQTHLDVPSHPHPRRTRSDQELIDGLLAESQEYQQSQRTADVHGVAAASSFHNNASFSPARTSPSSPEVSPPPGALHFDPDISYPISDPKSSKPLRAIMGLGHGVNDNIWRKILEDVRRSAVRAFGDKVGMETWKGTDYEEHVLFMGLVADKHVDVFGAAQCKSKWPIRSLGMQYLKNKAQTARKKRSLCSS